MKNSGNIFTRRALLAGGMKSLVVTSVLPHLSAMGLKTDSTLRAVNIMNFIRAEEPREKMDLFQPVREQMRLIKEHKLPATWLLQYDALVEGPFVEFLKAEMPSDHEVGIWFEMNRKICDDAAIAWRGNPAWEWDYHVPIAYAIGYTPDERRKLADTAMSTFRRMFGRDAKSIASWNLDAITIAHLSDTYHVDAFGNCRDQLATDGFTIWGAPIAAYYPSRKNAWSPALETKNQITTPMFRLLGQDPVYYYDKVLPYPDTMEPVWPSGQSEIFVDRFLEMIAKTSSLQCAYAQLGQENSFGWARMSEAYPMQMTKLSQAREKGLIVETMGETGRRFKRSFQETPAQAQIMLQDPYGKTNAPERTVWYQSKFLRADLHFRGNEFYLRDLHVYSDGYAEPYLSQTARQHGIQQRMLAVLDGYHWSDEAVRSGHSGRRAMARFGIVDKNGAFTPFILNGQPNVHQTDTSLQTTVPLAGNEELTVLFHERYIDFKLSGKRRHDAQLALLFEWADNLSTLVDAAPDQLKYRFDGFEYAVHITNGVASKTADEVKIVARENSLRLMMAQ